MHINSALCLALSLAYAAYASPLYGIDRLPVEARSSSVPEDSSTMSLAAAVPPPPGSRSSPGSTSISQRAPAILDSTLGPREKEKDLGTSTEKEKEPTEESEKETTKEKETPSTNPKPPKPPQLTEIMVTFPTAGTTKHFQVQRAVKSAVKSLLVAAKSKLGITGAITVGFRNSFSSHKLVPTEADFTFVENVCEGTCKGTVKGPGKGVIYNAKGGVVFEAK
ncbi:hypothetical protein FB446DRAFT_790619 [Lentinula raphanica]|nr:hypothetical protein FB446DRAFT_790619 [Lentinula raphanica]